MINNHFSELFRCEAPQSKIGLRYGALWGVMGRYGKYFCEEYNSFPSNTHHSIVCFIIK